MIIPVNTGSESETAKMILRHLRTISQTINQIFRRTGPRGNEEKAADAENSDSNRRHLPDWRQPEALRPVAIKSPKYLTGVTLTDEHGKPYDKAIEPTRILRRNLNYLGHPE
ncbi:hypothetical protein PO124_34235 [Bacillus licheniformis]|nr:hypothetical protein [Bacillus licheniformis]